MAQNHSSLSRELRGSKFVWAIMHDFEILRSNFCTILNVFCYRSYLSFTRKAFVIDDLRSMKGLGIVKILIFWSTIFSLIFCLRLSLDSLIADSSVCVLSSSSSSSSSSSLSLSSFIISKSLRLRRKRGELWFIWHATHERSISWWFEEAYNILLRRESFWSIDQLVDIVFVVLMNDYVNVCFCHLRELVFFSKSAWTLFSKLLTYDTSIASLNRHEVDVRMHATHLNLFNVTYKWRCSHAARFWVSIWRSHNWMSHLILNASSADDALINEWTLSCWKRTVYVKEAE